MREAQWAPALQARVPADEPAAPQVVAPYDLCGARQREGRRRSIASSLTLAMGSGVNLLMVLALVALAERN